MDTSDIHEAETHQSKLVERSARGQPVVIAGAGKRMMRMVPFDVPTGKPERRIGSLKGVHDFHGMGREEIGAMSCGGQSD